MRLIALTDNRWGIAKNGDILFPDFQEDRRMFRNMTFGCTVIMGGKTARSLPQEKPLPYRRNLVLSRSDPDSFQAGFTVYDNMRDLLRDAWRQKPPGTVWVIGGGQIYKALLPYCGAAAITTVDTCSDADTFMPDLDAAPTWRKVNRVRETVYNGMRVERRWYVNEFPLGVYRKKRGNDD